MKKAILIILGAAAFIYCRIQADRLYNNAIQQAVLEYRECTDPYADNWTIISDNVTATVYNACAKQCNSDYGHTASMYELNLDDVLSDRVIAMERTMMAEYGLKYGDVVMIEGAGRWDGIWQIQDTMNRRFAGQHKIDILVPNSIRHGKWENVKVYVPADEQSRTNALAQI